MSALRAVGISKHFGGVAALSAVVFEYRPLDRANLRWVIRRALRNGGTMAELEWARQDWKTTARRAQETAAHAIRELANVRAALWNRDGSSAVRHLLVACTEIGKLLHLAGIRIKEYRKHP